MILIRQIVFILLLAPPTIKTFGMAFPLWTNVSQKYMKHHHHMFHATYEKKYMKAVMETMATLEQSGDFGK